MQLKGDYNQPTEQRTSRQNQPIHQATNQCQTADRPTYQSARGRTHQPIHRNINHIHQSKPLHESTNPQLNKQFPTNRQTNTPRSINLTLINQSTISRIHPPTKPPADQLTNQQRNEPTSQSTELSTQSTNQNSFTTPPPSQSNKQFPTNRQTYTYQ